MELWRRRHARLPPAASAAAAPRDEAPNLKLVKGEKVEVGAQDEGYVGSWYEASILKVGTHGENAGLVQVQFDHLEDDDGAALTEWQPKHCLRPRPPGVLPGHFPPRSFKEGDPLQLWYNDGWWECVVVPAPSLSRKEQKARRKREQEHHAAVEAAIAAGEEEPPLPAGLGGDICVRFLHYPEVHPNINASQVRPCWTCRNGEWFWRTSGGVLQYLTTRMADGKTSRDGVVKPMYRKGMVPSGVTLNLLLESGNWRVEPPGEATEESRARAEWIACVTLVPKPIRSEERRPMRTRRRFRAARSASSSTNAGGVSGVGGAKLLAHSGHCRKPLVEDEDEALKDSPATCFAVGETVEVLQEDAGFEGSYYLAEVLKMAPSEEKAHVQYQAFEEEDGSGSKLRDWVELRRIRPRAPSTDGGFLATLSAGKPLEMKFEDGWWQSTLIYVGEADFLPPIVDPNTIEAGEIVPGLDKQQWKVVPSLGGDRSSSGQGGEGGSLGSAAEEGGQLSPPAPLHAEPAEHTWQCVEQPDRVWPSKRAGEAGALYVVATVHSDHVHMVDAAEARCCHLWFWRPNRWDVAKVLPALRVHRDVQLADEKRRLAEWKRGTEKKKDVAEAKRLQKLEELEAKRLAMDEEKEAKRKARGAEEAARARASWRRRRRASGGVSRMPRRRSSRSSRRGPSRRYATSGRPSPPNWAGRRARRLRRPSLAARADDEFVDSFYASASSTFSRRRR